MLSSLKLNSLFTSKHVGLANSINGCLAIFAVSGPRVLKFTLLCQCALYFSHLLLVS